MGADGPRVLWTDPTDGETEVRRRGPYLVGVDRLLLPGSVSRATVQIESGAVQAFVSVRFDPVDRVIIATPFFEQPLTPEVLWRLEVDGLRDLDDRSMDEPHVVAFTTRAELGPAYDPRVAGWEDVAPLFERSCTGAACHGPGDPALGLDLSSPEGVRETAVGVRSRQFPAGTVGAEGARGALSLAALPIVDVVAGSGRPATSYLLYKMIAPPQILGDPMPPPGSGHPPLDHEELRIVSAWVLAGAPTE